MLKDLTSNPEMARLGDCGCSVVFLPLCVSTGGVNGDSFLLLTVKLLEFISSVSSKTTSDMILCRWCHRIKSFFKKKLCFYSYSWEKNKIIWSFSKFNRNITTLFQRPTFIVYFTTTAIALPFTTITVTASVESSCDLLLGALDDLLEHLNVVVRQADFDRDLKLYLQREWIS